MPDAAETDDALLRAICELRGVVDQLIDEQLAQLGVADNEVGSPAGAVSARDVESDAEGFGPASPFASRLPSHSTLSPRRLFAELAAPASPTLARRVGGSAAVEDPLPAFSEGLDADPRQRLDALARHLDNRLRRVREPGSEPSRPADASDQALSPSSA